MDKSHLLLSELPRPNLHPWMRVIYYCLNYQAQLGVYGWESLVTVWMTHTQLYVHGWESSIIVTGFKTHQQRTEAHERNRLHTTHVFEGTVWTTKQSVAAFERLSRVRGCWLDIHLAVHTTGTTSSGAGTPAHTHKHHSLSATAQDCRSNLATRIYRTWTTDTWSRLRSAAELLPALIGCKLERIWTTWSLLTGAHLLFTFGFAFGTFMIPESHPFSNFFTTPISSHARLPFLPPPQNHFPSLLLLKKENHVSSLDLSFSLLFELSNSEFFFPFLSLSPPSLGLFLLPPSAQLQLLYSFLLYTKQPRGFWIYIFIMWGWQVPSSSSHIYFHP